MKQYLMGVVGLLMLGACSKTEQPDHTGIYQEKALGITEQI